MKHNFATPRRRPELADTAGERRISLTMTIAGYLVVLAVLIGAIQYGRGIVAEYDSMTSRLRAAENRAATAEKQLALMLRHGDRGVSLAYIDTTDLGRAEIRLVPALRK